MSVALDIQHAKRMRFMACLSQSIFPRYLMNGTIFRAGEGGWLGGGSYWANIFLLWSPVQILSEKYLISRRIERGSMVDVVLRVKCPLFYSGSDETLGFSTDFWKILKFPISWKSVPSRSRVFHPDRQTHMKTLIVAFHNSANSPKNPWLRFIIGLSHIYAFVCLFPVYCFTIIRL